MNPVILLPDGVGIRNFVLGPFLSNLARESRGLILHPIPEANLAEYRGTWNGHFQWLPAAPYPESTLAATLRYSLAYAQMYWADTQSMRYGRRARLRGTRNHRLMMRSARLIGRACASTRGIRCLDRLHCREVPRVPQEEHYRKPFGQ